MTLRLLAVKPLGAVLMRPSRATSRRTVQGIFRDQAMDAEVHVFEGVGHMPQIERPDEFAAVAGEFLARSAALAPAR